MYTEAQLYAFAHACRNTGLSAPILMQRLDKATEDGVFADCVWGNMSTQQVSRMVASFGLYFPELLPA